MCASPTTKFRALIVDDDGMSRQILSAVLQRLGASEVIEAEDGASAIQWADCNERELDLIVCDLRMPQLDGLETLAGLTARTRPSVVVLASSADPRLLRVAAEQAAQTGIERLHVISKPVTPEKMQAVIPFLRKLEGVDDLRWEAQTAIPLDCSSKLLRGISGGEFVPFFQPRWDVQAGRTAGAEAHLRWRHPVEGLFAPAAFMGVAQATDLLDELFLSVFVQIATRCAEWRRQGHNHRVTVAVPLPLLTTVAFPRRLEDHVTTYGALPDQITLELSEAAWLQNREQLSKVLTHLRLRGFGLAVSQFGTGYASAKQLLHSPITEIKIEAGFVRDAPFDGVAAAALASCVSLARELDLKVVADGVETNRQEHQAALLGCDQIQGPGFAPLMPAEEYERWLATPRRSLASTQELGV